MRNRWILAPAVLAVVVVPVLLAGCGSSEAPVIDVGQGTEAPILDTVTVNGTGRESGAPDEAVITLGVANEGSDATQALSENSQAMAAVVDKIKAAGVPEEAIKTSNVSLYPNMTVDPSTGQSRTQGYRAENQVRITLADASLLANVLEVAAAAGANTISGPEWRLSDNTEVAAVALVEALASARKKAEALAAAAGAKVGDLASISEGYSSNPIIYRSASKATAADMAQVPIEPGQVEVESVVTATYRLVR